MADSSWDNSGMPVSRQGMSVWAKVGLGCGIAFLLFVLTCGSCVWWGTSKFSGSLDQSWTKMRASVEALKTEDGAKSLYRENPGLKGSYPTEEAFVKAAEEWRPSLGELPMKRPDFMKLVKEHKMEFRAGDQPGRETGHIQYTLDSGKLLVMDLENGKLVDLRVQ